MSGKALQSQDGTSIISWNTEVVSLDSCDAVSRSLPCEPHPLGFESPSGLSRVAQLSAAQAVGIPFLLAYCMNQGGLVADRVILQRGDTCNWVSTILRLRLPSFLEKPRSHALPHGTLGISARARAAFPHKDGIAGQAKPVTLNLAADVISLDRVGFMSHSNFTPSHLPSTTIVLQKHLQAGQRVLLAAHVNRRFTHAAGSQQVPLVMNADWISDSATPFTLRAGVSHVSSDSENNESWNFHSLDHHLCLHSAAALTATFSSRMARNVNATKEAPGNAEAFNLDHMRVEERPSDLVNVRVKLPDGTIEDLGKHHRHITIAQTQRRPILACIQSPSDHSSTSMQSNNNNVELKHVRDLQVSELASSPGAQCRPGKACPSPEEISVPQGSRESDQVPFNDEFQQMVHGMQGKVTEATAQIKNTTASGVLERLLSSQKSLRETRGMVQNAQKTVRRGRVPKSGQESWLARQPVPWLWSSSPGFIASVQVGVAGRLPVDSQDVLRMIRGPGQRVNPGVPDNASLWGTLFGPIAKRLCMQPLLRARLEGTIGKFRRISGDHTSAVLEVETCSRGGGAARAGPELLKGQWPAGLCHVVSVSAKQQLVGPIRACADVRWEVGCGSVGVGEGGENGRTRWLGRLGRHLQGITARHTGLNVGFDASFGVARAAAWYSVHNRQGMIELRV